MKLPKDFGFFFYSVITQTLLTPIISFVFNLPIGAVLESSGAHPGDVHHPFARLGMPPIALATGYLLGFYVRRVFPRFSRGGRWAWVLPSLVFVLGILLYVRRDSVRSALLLMFDVEGEEGLGVWLVSLPAIFSVGYSLGCFLPTLQNTRMRVISACTILFLFSTLSAASEPKPEIVSLLTLVTEQSQVENPNAVLNGRVSSVAWEQVRIEHDQRGENKEVLIHSIRSRYDAESHAIEEIDRQPSREIHTTNNYENGVLVSMRGETISSDTGKPIGDEFWQTFKYGKGRLLELRRGRGQKLENHVVSEYDGSGNLISREIHQGENDKLIYTEQFRYTSNPPIVERRVILPNGKYKRSSKFRLDGADRVVEIWGEDGDHVRWKYDTQGRMTEQLTDAYVVPDGCDDCPIPGKIEIRYERSVREQTFFSPSGMPLLRRISQLEMDGSIASISYELLANRDDAPDLNRLVDTITPPAGNRYVETTWDDHANWTEKREYFRPTDGDPILQVVYRRKILYR